MRTPRTSTGAIVMPVDGHRVLSARDAMARAAASEMLSDPEACQCHGRIHVNVFFDGTQNHQYSNNELENNAHSNVARLYNASIEDPQKGCFSFYVPGVGTPFPEIGDSGRLLSGIQGAGFGKFGSDRINWGIIQVYNSVHRYLAGNDLLQGEEAQRIVSNMSSQMLQLGFVDWARRMILRTWEQRLADLVRSHQREVLDINISVFGFSRGAAQARAFVNRLFEIAKYNNEGCAHVLAGIPLNFTFLGIFDTVASVGSSSMLRVAKGRMAWADGDMMSIHPAVQKCVHFLALHEQRINFPLDRAVGSNAKEVLYPGMHSDVGGGYAPGEQGKAMASWGASPQLSQVPLIDMHFEAIKAGVPLRTWDEIQSSPEASSFSCDDRLVASYNDWLLNHGLPGGDPEEQIQAHTRQYIRWRSLRSQEGDGELVRQRYFEEAPQSDRGDLLTAQRWKLAIFRQLQAPTMRNLLWSNPLVAEFRPSDVPLSSRRLFDDYIHDSLAGFKPLPGLTEFQIPGLRTSGYFHYRAVFTVSSRITLEACESGDQPELPSEVSEQLSQLNMAHAPTTVGSRGWSSGVPGRVPS